MFVSLSSSKMIIRVYLVALFCAVVLGRSAEKDQQNPEDLETNQDTPLISPQSRKTDPKLDVIIAHQPGQPEPHQEIISSFKNFGKDAPEKPELIGEAKSELLQSPPVPVPPNPALSSRSRRFFLPYLSSSYRRPYYRRPYVRGGYYPYYFGGIFGYPYYGAGYGSYGYGDYGGGYYGGYGDYDGGYGDYGGGYGDYGGGFGDYGGGYGDIDIGIDSDY
ncbi:hypothetical protein DAPPUDRAFT_265386 [Daphnia pulex]|uniref:Uncharacterized protein n=1 Tax=Daphnia pulex TaxID=6669 RepID=E9HTC8_DAPPU|nr:hypothetical protein DAPPUDRAFT_265386 [Daphnia pulex]|eukprot:EFX64994.1 hypothetical protein DAPPUDRAFT_265386 [Daphnia pulex]